MEKTFGYLMTPTETAKNHFLYLNAYGYITDSPYFCIKREHFSDYLIMSCLSGKLYIEQYGKKAILSEGYSCLMNLNDFHYYYSDKNHPCKILWLHFGGNPFEALKPFLLPKHEFTIFENQQLPGLIEKNISIVQEDIKNRELRISSMLYEILIQIISIINEPNNQEEMAVHRFINKLDHYIMNHLSEKVTTEELAEIFHLNNSYFCRKVKQLAGLTPMQYVQQKKIQIAKYKLTYTDESISSISASLGFYDQNHFSFSFFKATTLYPSVYRNLPRNKKEYVDDN